MKKVKVLLVSICAIGLMVANSWAVVGELVLTDDQQGEIAAGIIDTPASQHGYYPAEAVVGGDDVIDFSTPGVTAPAAVVDIGAAAQTLTYTPATDLPSGTRITMILTGAEWVGTKLYLLKTEDVGALDYDGITVASTDVLEEGTALFVVGSSPINAGDILMISSAQDADETDNTLGGVNPSIKLNASLATPGNVTLKVTEAKDSVGVIVGGSAPAITIFSTYQQFVFTVGAGSSTINVEDPDYRRKFLTTNPISTATVTLTDRQGDDMDLATVPPEGAFYAVNLATALGTATVDYAIAGTQLNKLLTVAGLTNTTVTPGTESYTIVDDTLATLSVDTFTDAELYSSSANTITFTVNGVDTLDTQSFTLNAKLNFTDNTKYNDVSLSSTTVLTWGINGAQFVVPHMISRDTFESYLIVKTTTAANTGDIFVDMMRRNGDVVKLTKAELPVLALEDGSDGGFAQITAKALLDAAGWALGDEDNDFKAKIIITLPQSQVFVDGFKYGAGNTYPMPVYEYKGWGINAADVESFQYVK